MTKNRKTPRVVPPIRERRERGPRELENRIHVLIEGILSGLSYGRAWIAAGYSPNQGLGYMRLRRDPRVLAAIETALEAHAMTRARLVGGLLQIAEDTAEKATDRISAWRVLADVYKFVDAGKNAAPPTGQITVVFEDARGELVQQRHLPDKI